MSGGEPSSIKLVFPCAARAPGLSLSVMVSGISAIQSRVCSLATDREPFLERENMYQALYRKWRPVTFDDVIGQEHITETLKNQIRTDRLSHAYLFIGTRGTGKTSCAKILARAVNCEHPVNGNPCNECPSCRGILNGSVMDVVELDAASNNGVDNVRALREEAVFTPAEVKKRVYIIDEVHMLSISAFNALLKILEEPPEHLMFILATTELNKVPATILSRCQRHSFRRIDADVIAKRLCYISEHEMLGLDSDAADLLANLADGSMRDALSLLDQCAGRDNINTDTVLSALGLAGNRAAASALEAIAAHDTQSVLELFGRLWRDGKDPSAFLSELSTLSRDILMSKIAPKSGNSLLSGGFDSQTISYLSNKLKNEDLLVNINSIQTALAGMRNIQNPRIAAELCLIGLCEPDLGDGLPALRARVSALEAGSVNIPVPVQMDHRSAAAENPLPDDLPWDEPDPVKSPAKEAVEPIKVPDPAPAPKEADPPSVSVSGDKTDIWQNILHRIKGSMAIGTYSIISDPFHASGELRGNLLTVHVANDFARGMLDKPDITELLRRCASELTGQTLTVKFDDRAQAPAANAAQLDSLSKFSNVKFSD